MRLRIPTSRVASPLNSGRGRSRGTAIRRTSPRPSKTYNAWLRRSPIPKLFLWAKPGMIVRGEKAARQIAVMFPNTETVFVGEGRHYIQEDQPDAIGEALSDWLGRTA